MAEEKTTPKKPRYVKTTVPLLGSSVEIYAGSKVGHALKKLQNLDIYQGAKLIDQELRTESVGSLMDEVCYRHVGDVTLERIPALDFTVPAQEF